MDNAKVLYLVPIAGLKIEPFELVPREDRPGGLTLGRHESSDLKMPPGAESVSRAHARFRFDVVSVRWRMADLGSRWGTFLNGVKLAPRAEVPIGEGDLVRVEPWTFAISANLRPRGVISSDDTGQSMIRTFNSDGSPPAGAPLPALREDLLALLLEAAASFHDATTETELADRLLETVIRGSGMQNAAVIHPIDASGQFGVLAVRHAARSETSADTADRFGFSRSLLAAAGKGQVVELSNNANTSESIFEMKVLSALCVPLMLGTSPAAYLYLDSRVGRSGAGVPKIRPQATAFCAALGKLAGLSLANLKRLDVERRHAIIERDLYAAAAAQKWVLPRRETTIGSIQVVGESRSGRYVGGDFFDVVDLGNGRVAIALGDVSGKGVDASVLMTATQGFLHAALLHHGDPGLAVTAANRFVFPRRPDTRFVTLWAATIDPTAKTISYVDAGHSYALLADDNAESTSLDVGGGPPLGVEDGFRYVAEVVPLPDKARIVVVSDGIIEQAAGLDRTNGARVQFKIDGVKDCLRLLADDHLANLFEQLIKHAGTDHLADDATAVFASVNS